MTLFQEDSHASRFPWLESKREKTMIVTCGRKCSELSENLRRVGWLVRTYLESCALPPGRWLRIWSVKDMTSRCLILKLRLSERGTDGNGSPLLPTVRSQETGQYQYAHGDHSKKVLTLTGSAKLWPTPKATEWKGSGPAGSKSNIHDVRHGNLKGYAIMFPTHRAQSANGTSNTEKRQGAADLQTVCGGQLNPAWVEWLMGFPIGWTESQKESKE